MSLAVLCGGDGNAVHLLLQQRNDVVLYKTPNSQGFQQQPAPARYTIPAQVHRELPAAGAQQRCSFLPLLDRDVRSGDSHQSPAAAALTQLVDTVGNTAGMVELVLPDLGKDSLIMLQTEHQRQWYTSFGGHGIFVDATHNVNR